MSNQDWTDRWLSNAANKGKLSDAPTEAASSEIDHYWDAMESWLQAAAPAPSAPENGESAEDAPATIPDEVMEGMIRFPELARAYARLAEPVQQAKAGTLGGATELPEQLRATIAAEAASPAPVGANLLSAAAAVVGGAVASASTVASAAAGTVDRRLELVVEQSGSVLKTLVAQGLQVVAPELVMVRDASATPTAYQGMLGDRYLVALALSSESDNTELAVQCQEIEAGQATPRPVPSFCLVDPEGERHHSRNRMVRLDELKPGSYNFQLEVVGKPEGELCVEIK